MPDVLKPIEVKRKQFLDTLCDQCGNFMVSKEIDFRPRSQKDGPARHIYNYTGKQIMITSDTPACHECFWNVPGTRITLTRNNVVSVLEVTAEGVVCKGTFGGDEEIFTTEVTNIDTIPSVRLEDLSEDELRIVMNTFKSGFEEAFEMMEYDREFGSTVVVD